MKLLCGILLISACVTVVLSNSTIDATTTDATTLDATTLDATTKATTPVDNTTILTTDTKQTTATQKPTPSTTIGSWEVIGENNKTCILATMAILFSISYEKNDSTTDTIDIQMPPSASSSDSECAGNTSSSTLKLDFFTDWFVEMKFVLGSSVDTLDDDKYYMNSFTLQYVLDDNFKNPAKPGTTMSATRTNNDFGTTIGKSYECESKTDLTINDDVEMDISDLRIQPFAERSDGEYGESESCTMDTVNDNLIAIIVGCCLAGLIIIVVIGYCVGRYRKKSYTSI